MSEIMTILIHFHQSNYRNFYLEHVVTHLRNEFPGLVSSWVITPLSSAR